MWSPQLRPEAVAAAGGSCTKKDHALGPCARIRLGHILERRGRILERRGGGCGGGQILERLGHMRLYQKPMSRLFHFYFMLMAVPDTTRTASRSQAPGRILASTNTSTQASTARGQLRCPQQAHSVNVSTDPGARTMNLCALEMDLAAF